MLCFPLTVPFLGPIEVEEILKIVRQPILIVITFSPRNMYPEFGVAFKLTHPNRVYLGPSTPIDEQFI